MEQLERRIHVCYFADGGSIHTQRWLREFVARGMQVTLVTRRPWSYPGVTVMLIPGTLGIFNWFFCIPKIRRILRSIRPDIVHGHYITSFGFLAAVSGVRPLVQTAWGSDILVTPKHNFFVRWLTGWALSQADLITADSLDVLTAIESYSPKARLEQVQWGVDLSAPIYEKEDAAELNLVSLREWAPNYNIDVVVRGFAGLLHSLPTTKARLHLVGGGQLEGVLKSLVTDLGIERHVTFHGRIGEDRLQEILTASDISITVPTSDATAMSLLESMAAGLPVVVSDLPANRQWIDETGGRIVADGDEKALVKVLLELAQDKALRRTLGMRNRAIVEARASRTVEMDRMFKLYRELFQSAESKY